MTEVKLEDMSDKYTKFVFNDNHNDGIVSYENWALGAISEDQKVDFLSFINGCKLFSQGVTITTHQKLPSQISDPSRLRSVGKYVDDFKERLKADMRCVVCAANKYDNVIIPSARHFDSLMHELIALLPFPVSPGKWEQGFIDQFGVFMTREEAWKVAEANGQILHQVSEPGILYSENLY